MSIISATVLVGKADIRRGFRLAEGQVLMKAAGKRSEETSRDALHTVSGSCGERHIAGDHCWGEFHWV